MRIRSAREILATLGEGATLDGLPFMPEMLKFCGQTARVSAVAHKTCDTITWTGLRRMRDAVHLSDLRCDGSAHGGCQAGCLLFWKTDWIELEDDAAGRRDTSSIPQEELSAEDLRRLHGACRQSGGDDVRWSCQATQLLQATDPQPWWDIRQYAADVASGNIGVGKLLRGMAVFLFNKYQGLSKRVLPASLRIRQGAWFPLTAGRLEKTPREQLGLHAGDPVRVKSRPEILATLDRQGRNRGLSFDVEMLPYCTKPAQVLRRVERIIDEATGKMTSIGGDCLVLDGVTCQARYHRFCPRAIYPYWREIWLERRSPEGDQTPEAGQA